MDEEMEESSEKVKDESLVEVKVGGKIRTAKRKRLIKLSPYFESRINRFQIDAPIVLENETVTASAWKILSKFMVTNKLDIDPSNALEVLIAANYLSIDAVQVQTATFLKNHVSKQDFVQYWEIAKNMRIVELDEFISGAILKPSEVKRKRICGEFDLCLVLGNLHVKCHKSVVFDASKLLKSLTKEDTHEGILNLDATLAGLGPDDGQRMFNMIEMMYGSTVTDDPVGVLQIVSKLGMCKAFMKKLIKQLVGKLSIDNAMDVYRIGKQINYQDIINMSLHFFMYKFSSFLDNDSILDLNITDFKKLICHDNLNVESESVVLRAILKYCIANKKEFAHLDDLLKSVRWKFIAEEEVPTSFYIMDLLPSSAVETIQSHASGCHPHDVRPKRGWPQLLILIEQPPYSIKRGEKPIPSEAGACTVQAYDMKDNTWVQLTEVPETEMNWNMYKRNNKMTRRGRYSSQCTHNKVILTLPKFEQRTRRFDVGVHTSMYDIWSGDWTSDFKVAIRQHELLEHHARFNPEEEGKFAVTEQHSSVMRNFPASSQKLGSLFTFLPTGCKTKDEKVSPSNILLSECVMLTRSNGRVSQKWRNHVLDCESLDQNRIPQLAATNKNVHLGINIAHPYVHLIDLLPTNNNGSASLHTYNTEIKIWGKGALFSKKKAAVDGASYIGFLDSIFAVGGARIDNQETSGRVSKFPPEGGNASSVQCLERGRMSPGLAEFDGKMYAAGGYNQRWEGGSLVRDVEATVEYYVPATDTWHLMNDQPKIKYGRVALGVVDKPIRLIKSLSL